MWASSSLVQPYTWLIRIFVTFCPVVIMYQLCWLCVVWWDCPTSALPNEGNSNACAAAHQSTKFAAFPGVFMMPTNCAGWAGEWTGEFTPNTLPRIQMIFRSFCEELMGFCCYVCTLELLSTIAAWLSMDINQEVKFVSISSPSAPVIVFK